MHRGYLTYYSDIHTYIVHTYIHTYIHTHIHTYINITVASTKARVTKKKSHPCRKQLSILLALTQN